MSWMLVIVVIGVVALLVFVFLAALLGSSAQKRQQATRNDAAPTGGTDAGTLNPMLMGAAASQLMTNSSTAPAGGHGESGAGSANDYSTNNFSGPDPASDAGVSFGDSGGGGDGGGGD